MLAIVVPFLILLLVGVLTLYREIQNRRYQRRQPWRDPRDWQREFEEWQRRERQS